MTGTSRIEGLRRALDLVIHAERVVSGIDEAIVVVERFLDEDCDCMVLFIQTWNWASRIMQAAHGDLDAFVQHLRSEYIHMAYGELQDDLVVVCEMQ